MARIRSIHPGLFTDEEFMALTMETPLACVLLTGIWCECDDDGVFDWKVLTLKARYLPVADADVEGLLKALEDKRFIQAFEKDGKPLGAVRNFRKYQRPKKPTTRGLLPNELREYVGLEPKSSEPVPHQFPTSGEKSPQKEEGGEEVEKGSTPPTPPKRGGRRAKSPEPEYPPEFEAFWQQYPRKVAKDAALKAWRSAQKRAPPEQITAGAMRFSAQCGGKEAKFIPHASTWLNGGRWKDEPENDRRNSPVSKQPELPAYLAALGRSAGG